KGFHGEAMQIAVLDAGFQQYKSITAFDSIRMNGQILGERDFVTYDNSVNEDDSHGMQCLSILSANWPGKMVGTAPKANYWLIRTENAASEYPIEEYNWLVGAEFADSTGCDLISTSLGYNTFDDPAFNHSYADIYKNTTTISQGASLAARKGMIVSVSAGNEGNDPWKYLTFPADADSVCSVGAVNRSGLIAGFSSYGYPGKVKPDIVSVGVATVIAGLNDQPVTGNGTSFANPNVAGLIACLWQAFPKFSNIKILEAVYKSSDKFNNPDNRYGYGIPNFRVAYQLLKHDENIRLYGDDWLFATPNPFTADIAVRSIGRIDGNVTISLLNAAGQVVASQAFLSEKEEVSDHTFSSLGNLPAGLYSIRYTDGTNTRTIIIQKGNLFAKDWLVAQPNPFSNDITVYIKGQETGEVLLRLIDTKGSVVAVVHAQVIQNETYTAHFNFVNKLP
ncbi:MAG: S8 family serine peptidase, partial [Segetibacter sp.]